MSDLEFKIMNLEKNYVAKVLVKVVKIYIIKFEPDLTDTLL